MHLDPRFLPRYKDIALLFLRHAKPAIREQAGVEQLAGRRRGEDEEDRPEAFAAELERMGPTFVKFGQLLSTRGDLLPERYMAALERLQDDVDPLPFEAIAETVQSELGFRISHGFDSFEERPLASASIGQVHRATLRGGRPVAVKVQRPRARSRISNDLEALERIAAFADEHTALGRKYRFCGIVDQFRRSLEEELDYRLEAQNLRRIDRQLRSFPRLFAPPPIDGFCTGRVLTLAHVDGAKVTSLSGIAKTELDGEALADQMLSAYLQHVLVDGFYHADPHPGNLILTPDHRIALIDLGMVGRIGERMRDELFRLLTGISDNDGDRAAEAALRIGRVDRGHLQVKEFEGEISDCVARSNTASIEDMRFGTVVMDVMRICGAYGVEIPREVSMLGKTLLHLDRIGLALDPGFNPNASIQRNVDTLARKRAWQSLRSGSLLSGMLELKEILVQTPRRFNDILEMAANNQLRVEVDALDERRLIRGFQKIANRITVGLILGAMIVGASYMMRIETGFMLLGYPGIPILLFLFAAISGIGLLVSIWRKDE